MLAGSDLMNFQLQQLVRNGGAIWLSQQLLVTLTQQRLMLRASTCGAAITLVN
jgi:hypothetical protein